MLRGCGAEREFPTIAAAVIFARVFLLAALSHRHRKTLEHWQDLRIFHDSRYSLANFERLFGGCDGNILQSVLDSRLASRLAAIPVLFTMIVAYLTADQEAVAGMLSNSDKFVKADPFPFLLIALIVLAFGPGQLSVDALFKQKLWHSAGTKPNR